MKQLKNIDDSMQSSDVSKSVATETVHDALFKARFEDVRQRFINQLDGYLTERAKLKDEQGGTLQCSHSSLFAPFQNSFNEEKSAIEALIGAVLGERLVLLPQLATINSGKLWSVVNEFIKQDQQGNVMAARDVRSVSDFVRALNDQIAPRPEPR